jgi:hypothetical protein
MTHEEESERKVAERQASVPTDRNRFHGEQFVMHFKRGDRIRASGYLYELLQDVDAVLITDDREYQNDLLHEIRK